MALNKLHSPSKYNFLLCNVHLFVRIRNNICIVPNRAQNMVTTVVIMHVNTLEESKAILKMSSS